MERKEHLPKVLVYQSVGFLAIIASSWLDDWLGLSTLVFGDHPAIPEFHASAVAMLIILAVWLIVGNATRRALDHMRYLAGFMRLCAWCHRIEHHGRWMPIEEFLQLGFDTPTTHGICRECLNKQMTAMARARNREIASSVSG